MLANSTIWKANRTKQWVVKTAVLAKFNNVEDQSACINCGVGKFNDLEGQANCKNCGVGKFNDLEGQSDEAVACKNCGVGKYTSSDQTACIKCGVGKFNDLEGQSDEAVACKDCGVGKFNDLEGQSDEAAACKICGTGTFNNVVVAAACAACPLNTLIQAASICCTQPGTYQTSDQCFTCPQPQYCQGGTTCTGNREGLACMKCKTNYYTIDGNDCIPAPNRP